MKTVLKFAVASAVTVLAGSTMCAFADEAPSGKPTVTIAAGKDLQVAQKDLTAKRYEEALSTLDKIKANPKKNDYDEYLMNAFYVTAYVGEKKYQQAIPPLEATMASKYMSGAELKQHLVQITLLEYNLQNYDKTVEYGTRVLKEGANPQIETVVAQSYYQKNDFKDAERFVRAMVDAQIKAGQVPSEEVLLMGQDAARRLNDDHGMSHWTELLVTYHPKPDYWLNLLHGMYGANHLSDRQSLQIYRLSADVGALKRGSDYADMAQLSLVVGAPGEAVSTLSKGFAANVFTDQADKNRNQHLLDSAKKQVAADQPTMAKTEADATGAATGDPLAGVGIAYFGTGDYAKAIKDLSAGLSKGVKDAADARLSLGIAQYRAGDKDAALKTFKEVKGDPVSERLATLWALHVRA